MVTSQKFWPSQALYKDEGKAGMEAKGREKTTVFTEEEPIY